MAIYSFTFLAAPTPDAKEFDTAGGAYVTCWIRSDDPEAAEQKATDLIYEYKWVVEGLEDEALVTGDDYVDDDENREFYEQALVEGEVLVFHTWPPVEGDEDI
jgi:hypothetical protein